MDLQNVSGEAIALTKVGIEIANGATATGVDDKWLQDEDISALVTAGKLVASNYDTSAGSAVVQPEVSAAVAASHTHANQAELDLVADGDHDARIDNPHAVDAAQAGADVAGSAATVQGNLDTHAGTVTGNPHVVTAAEVAVSNDWTTPPTGTVVGESVFDTTAGQPYWWTGAGWVDATGAAHA